MYFRFQLLVLKQSWGPRDVDPEGYLYDAAKGSECEEISKIDYWEEVKIAGDTDATDTLIRRGLDASTGLGKRGTNGRPTTNRLDTAVDMVYTSWGDIQEVKDRGSGQPVARTRMRTVFSTYGWLIKYFSTRQELIRVLRDAIKGMTQVIRIFSELIVLTGHKHLYLGGVLHRDISSGNIVIECRPGSDANKASGRLIDLDHSKAGKPALPILRASVDDRMIGYRQMTVQYSTDIEVDKDVARFSLEFASNGAPTKEEQDRSQVYTIAAVRHAKRFYGLVPDQPCTLQHLRWKQVWQHDFPSLPF